MVNGVSGSSVRVGAVAWVLAGALLGSLLTATRGASACSYGVPSQPREVRCDAADAAAAGGAHTSIAGANFGVAALGLQRTRLPPPGALGCSSPSELTLEFQWGDGEAWPRDIGLLLTVEAGDFPWYEPMPADTRIGEGWLLAADAGEVRFFGFDDPYEALDVTVAARAVDCEGALSPPLLLRVSDPGLPEPPGDGSDLEASDAASVGCALEPAAARGAASVSPVLLGVCLALLATRRDTRRVR